MGTGALDVTENPGAQEPALLDALCGHHLYYIVILPATKSHQQIIAKCVLQFKFGDLGEWKQCFHFVYLLPLLLFMSPNRRNHSVLTSPCSSFRS